MRVRDLSLPITALNQPFVVLDDLGAPYDFRELKSHARFGSMFDSTLLGEADGVVFVGDTLKDATQLTEIWARGAVLQAWLPLGAEFDLADLEALNADADPSLEIVALSVTKEWAKMQLEVGNRGRPMSDLLTGVRIGLAMGAPPIPVEKAQEPESVQARMIQNDINLRAEIVTRLVRKGKPIKRFLPPRAVQAAYKMIGALR